MVIGPEEALLSTTLHANNLRWTQGRPPEPDEPVAVKIRYRNAPLPARVRVEDDRMAVAFERPQRAVTPGQAAVVYRGDEVLGGGTICATASVS